MTKISPLLQNRIEAGKNGNPYHSSPIQIGEVKPNLPKAKLIKENALQSAVSAVKDTFQDGKNFFKATKTGKMNDNNLGRINDLGMKAGALLIASYLASHAKTKTDAIMQFIGGTTFFASMALWPKIALNLPARLVHGFRIDHKYLSAQGDKKDLGLDNHFQPMDIFSDEEMMDMAKKAGIDPNDEFAREKMQRKLQKTMLQNRTLWMATAGFATPLMTSLIGNAVEPKVRNAVINHDVNKTKNIISNEGGLVNYLKHSKAKATNEKEIAALFERMGDKYSDKTFYQELADLMSINNVFEKFRDPDDVKPILSLESENIIPILRQKREDTSYVSKESLIEMASNMKTTLGDGLDAFVDEAAAPLGKKGASELFEGLDDRISLTQAKRALKACFDDSQIDEAMKDLKVDNSQFFSDMKDYNSGALANLRGRVKAYIDLINPVVGSKSESAYTADFTETMKEVLNTLGIKDKDYKFLQDATQGEQQEFLSGKIKQILAERGSGSAERSAKLSKAIVDFTSGNKEDANNLKGLKDSLAEIFGEDFYLVKNEGSFNNFAKYITADNQVWKDEIVREYTRSIYTPKINHDIESLAGQLAESKNLEQIAGNPQDMLPITKALTGGKLGGESGLTKFIQNFIANKRVDLMSTKFKPLLAINFEERLMNGEFKDMSKEEIEAMKGIVYDGTVSLRNNNAEIRNPAQHAKLLNAIFDVNPQTNAKFNKFNMEEAIAPGFKSYLENLYYVKNDDTYATAKYFTAGSFVDLIKNFATRLNENKTWKKIFIPMAIAVATITLLVQPLFGKIDKEFPKKGEKEGVNNGNK